MAKKTLSDIDVSGKRALVRVDFNVPLNEDQQITDDTRIRAAVPTIQYLLQGGASVVLMSHMGRPKGRVVPEMSLAPAAVRLAELLDIEVKLAPDCAGSAVEAQAAALQPGHVMLLENLRYKPEEEANDPEFAKALAGLGDLYVNDAFGAAHRGHASTEGIAHHVPVSVSGLLMEREITYLDEALKQPARPFVAILGGAKISGKIEVIENLLDKVDALIVGGGMSYTFFKAMGLEIGVSLLEEDRIQVAKDLIDRCREQDVELLLPTDVVVADRFAIDAQTQIVQRDGMPAEWEGVDIGPATRARYCERVRQAGTVVWNGPLGVFEMKPFAQGTLAVAQALVQATEGGTISIIGGGDTAAAVTQMGLADEMTHISTGGGASLECMGGRILPGIVALSDKENA